MGNKRVCFVRFEVVSEPESRTGDDDFCVRVYGFFFFFAFHNTRVRKIFQTAITYYEPSRTNESEIGIAHMGSRERVEQVSFSIWSTEYNRTYVARVLECYDRR